MRKFIRRCAASSGRFRSVSSLAVVCVRRALNFLRRKIFYLRLKFPRRAGSFCCRSARALCEWPLNLNYNQVILFQSLLIFFVSLILCAPVARKFAAPYSALLYLFYNVVPPRSNAFGHIGRISARFLWYFCNFLPADGLLCRRQGCIFISSAVFPRIILYAPRCAALQTIRYSLRNTAPSEAEVTLAR